VTAHEILSRIRWDVDFTWEDNVFEMDVVDRPAGIVTITITPDDLEIMDKFGVELWVDEEADAEQPALIPLHRIREIRRKSGEVVWKREKTA